MSDLRMPYTTEVASLKLFSTEMCCDVCKDARQIHGANGLNKNFEIERCLRDSHMLTVAEGTSEICKIVVSNALYHSKIDEYS
jgi:alkylation response protein AidB-like acyl-CoA dehydrogenase